jgi:hypothetical protein
MVGYMSLVKNLYMIATMTIASLFIGLFIVGLIKGQFFWFCFIPVVIVIWEFVRTVKEARLEARFRPLQRSRWTLENEEPAFVLIWEEFIKEEEFKV